MADFAAAYLAGSPTLRPFFAHAPGDFAAAAGALGPWNEDMRSAMLDEQARLGLARKIPAESLAIVTGQQPGLLTGPLYTVYKAITAIQLAERESAKLGRPVVPVFWVAADDHDFEEVREAHLLSQDHADCALRYEPGADIAGLPMHRVPLEGSLHGLVDVAAREAPGAEFREEVRAFLHESLDQSTSFSGWFARILARLFRDTPLLIFSTDLPASRVVAAPVFAREIQTPLASTRLLNDAGKQLAAHGFPPQVVKADDECAFFVEVAQRRRKVLYRDGHFVLPEESRQFTREEMLAWLRARPADFSANVALRPVVQQTLFPTLAYVGGPGELAYWAQFRGIFEHFGQPMPVVCARAGAVLTTIKLNKLLAKYGLGVADLAVPREELLLRALAASVKSPARDAFRAQRPALDAAIATFRAKMLAVKKLDKTLATQVETAAENLAGTLDRLEKSLLRADESQTETVRKQVERVTTALMPERKPQERHYSVFSFLFEHGWELIPRLSAALDAGVHTMQEIEL